MSFPSLSLIRDQFPALRSETTFFENAGGSQIPRSVIESVQNYFYSSYVNPGAGYSASVNATQTVSLARETASILFGASPQESEVIFGASSTQLARTLSQMYGDVLNPGDEIIVADFGHEANVGCWLALEKRGVQIKLWPFRKELLSIRTQDLDSLFSKKTKLVIFPHVSNVLGEVLPVKEITQYVHSKGARVVVDGVAYASHLAMDVKDWDVDWYFYSAYKVYGPHMGVLYGTKSALSELSGQNHFWLQKNPSATAFELGALNYEGCAGLVGLRGYLQFLSGKSGPFSRETVLSAFECIELLEQPLTKRFLDFLNSKKEFTIWGTKTVTPTRLVTISFTHATKTPAQIAALVDPLHIGIKTGHMASYRLMEMLGLNPQTGVVRASFSHYNSLDEVNRLIGILENA